MQLFEREVKQSVEHHNESLPVIQTLDLLVKTTEWMLAPMPILPASPAESPATPTSTPATPTSAPSTPTISTPSSPTQLQQKFTDIIHGWHHKAVLLDNATNLYSLPQLSYYEHLIKRFTRIIEVVCTLDRSFLEQLLSALHEQLSRDDETLPASLIANSVNASAESMHRRRMMQHRDQFDRPGEDLDETLAHAASSAYNTFLITIINFVLNPPAPSTPTTPSATNPLAPTAIDIAVQTAKNAYIQQRQPHAIKQHANLQVAILQYLIRLQQNQQIPQDPLLSQPTSFTQAIDLLRQIWDHPQHGPVLKENRSLDSLVTLLLVDGPFLLDTPTAFDTVALFYTHCAAFFAPGTKEKLLRGLGERLASRANQSRRERQATGSWSFETLCAIIHVCLHYIIIYLLIYFMDVYLICFPLYPGVFINYYMRRC